MACERDFLKSFIPILFATAAFFMGLLGNFYCETISFSATDSDLPELLFGVFYYKAKETVQLPPDNRTVVRDKCYQYPVGTYKDPKWKTAMSFAVITAIIGGIFLFWAWLSPCFYVGKARWKHLAYIFILMTLFQGLTLIFLSSNACQDNALVSSLAENQSAFYQSSCGFGWGSSINVAAVVCWFIAGVLMLTIIPPPKRPDPGPKETHTVTYTQTEQPDGTKVVTETTVKGQYVEQPSKTDAAAPKEEPVTASAQVMEEQP